MSERHEACERRGGVCDCGVRPCALDFGEQWFAEMRGHGVPDEQIAAIWEAGRTAGRLLRGANEGKPWEFDEQEVVEALKDAAYALGLFSLTGRRRTGPDTWTTIEVRHPSGLEDSPDGWVSEISHGEL